jgi:SAM-dependent methyltransferase
MLDLFRNELARCEQQLADSTNASLVAATSSLPLEIFGELMLERPSHLPAIARRLPTMPPDEVQRNWTGNCGAALMGQSLAFVKTLLAIHGTYGSRKIHAAQILDFGCGWGRLLRLMLKYAPAGNLYGVDPWSKSIGLCRQHDIPCQLAVSDYVPQSLPFSGPFDLVYAFSVFTHLSERTTRVVLSTLRRAIADDGVLCITIRPVEYWAHLDAPTRSELMERHRTAGFAFVPHAHRELIDGEVTYGDTSMTLEYLEQLAPGWRIGGVEWNDNDRLQVVVALLPA